MNLIFIEKSYFVATVVLLIFKIKHLYERKLIAIFPNVETLSCKTIAIFADILNVYTYKIIKTFAVWKSLQKPCKMNKPRHSGIVCLLINSYNRN